MYAVEGDDFDLSRVLVLKKFLTESIEGRPLSGICGGGEFKIRGRDKYPVVP